jgi:hypothetical protein
MAESGLRRLIRNQLSTARWTGGSNPSLSAKGSKGKMGVHRRRDARDGRRGTTGNRVCTQKVYRGFESLSLRHAPVRARPKSEGKGGSWNGKMRIRGWGWVDRGGSWVLCDEGLPTPSGPEGSSGRNLPSVRCLQGRLAITSYPPIFPS